MEFLDSLEEVEGGEEKAEEKKNWGGIRREKGGGGPFLEISLLVRACALERNRRERGWGLTVLHLDRGKARMLPFTKCDDSGG